MIKNVSAHIQSAVTNPVTVKPDGVTAQPVRELTDSLQSGTSALTPKFAAINASEAGDTAVVALVASKRIRMIRYSLVCGGAVTVTWKSSTAGAISGPMAFAANGGISEPEAPRGICQTAVGEALVLNLGGAVAVGGWLTYVEV